MAELRDRSLAVVLCQAGEGALDALVPPGHGARPLRVAPDESLFVCDPAVAPEVVREIGDRIAALDEDAVVLDVTDGWAFLGLVGEDVGNALAYVSALEAPEPGRFVQGALAQVAAKVLGEDDGLTILVPAYWHEHVRTRLRDDTRTREVDA